MIVISLLFDHAPGALANHRRYARMHGYRHIEIDMSELSGSSANVLWMYKYETLLHGLNQAESGEIVMLLNENCAIIGSQTLPELLENRDWLLTCAETEHPQTAIQIWRNTDAVRREIHKVVTQCRFSMKLPADEGLLLCEFDSLPAFYKVNDINVVVPAALNLECVWATWPAFSVCTRDEKHHRRYRAALFAHINECMARGMPFFSFHNADIEDSSASSVFNAGQPIAIVTLYTPNVASYGSIAEANFRRYCERHGYTLYVHREIPAHLNDGKTAGNWLKPALLREYLPHHEWVFWVDADVLFNDMNRKLESIMQGQDALFARDVGTWTFNSGIMGFRRTQANYDAFHYILHACSQLDDRSCVYANLGDQHFFIGEYEKHADFDATRVASFIDWNTAWIYRRAESFLVHYIGMWHDNKALLMNYDIEQSAAQ